MRGSKLLPQPPPVCGVLSTLGPMRTIFDIGCDDLTHSTPFFRAACPEAKIFCFEPDPRHALTIANEGKASALAVDFHPMALADKPGTREFWQSSGEHPFSGSLRTPRSFAINPTADWHFISEPILVCCTTIDGFCEENAIESIDLLHMDVQGAEDLVLKGAARILPRIRYISAEHNTQDYVGNPGLDGIMALLPGWEIIQNWPYDVLLRNQNFE